jgi:hypothetical protein
VRVFFLADDFDGFGVGAWGLGGVIVLGEAGLGWRGWGREFEFEHWVEPAAEGSQRFVAPWGVLLGVFRFRVGRRTAFVPPPREASKYAGPRHV